MIGEMHATADHAQVKKQEESSYRRVWLVSFSFFFLLAAVTRLLPRPILATPARRPPGRFRTSTWPNAAS